MDVTEMNVPSGISHDSVSGREESSSANDVEVDIIPEVQSKNMQKIISNLEKTSIS